MGQKVKFNGKVIDYNKELLTKEQWEKIDNYFIMGIGVKRIAKEFNISTNFVQQYFYEFLALKKINKIPLNIESLQEHLVTKTETVIGHKTIPYYKTEKEQLFYLEPKYTWESLSRQEQMFYLHYKPEGQGNEDR
jgi:predicted DNA-binding protein YlxM (UPF0122 family)